MSRLTERLARQPQLTTSNEPAAAPDERAPVGIQPRGPDLAAAETQYAACRTAWLEALRVRTLEEGDWRPLDPEAATLVDIDAPEDLARLR